MHERIAQEASSHHEAEELLPWFATGQLEGEDLRLVEQHISSCAHCRRQLAFERRMIGELGALTPEIDDGWARLRQRLEFADERRWRSWLDRIGYGARLFWETFRRPAVATFAVAQLGFVIVAAALLLSLSRPSYRALGSASSPSPPNAIAIFAGNTSVADMATLLRSSGASLVGGPTSADAYLLRVPAKSRPAVLAKLGKDPHVLLAEPIDKASS